MISDKGIMSNKDHYHSADSLDKNELIYSINLFKENVNERIEFLIRDINSLCKVMEDKKFENIQTLVARRVTRDDEIKFLTKLLKDY